MRAALLVLAVALAGCAAGTSTPEEFARRTGRDAVAAGTAPATAPRPDLPSPELPDVTPATPEVLDTAPPPVAFTPTAAPTPVDLFAGTAARDVANAFAAQLGADLRPVELVVYPGYAFLSRQDPAQPSHLDRYEYRDGQVSGPMPLPVVGTDPLEAQMFDLGAVALERVPELVAATVRDLAYEQGAATHVTVTRNLPFSNDVVIRVYVDGPRNSGRIDYFADGTPKQAYP
jgi:hypothetical protein